MDNAECQDEYAGIGLCARSLVTSRIPFSLLGCYYCICTEISIFILTWCKTQGKVCIQVSLVLLGDHLIQPLG